MYIYTHSRPRGEFKVNVYRWRAEKDDREREKET